MPNKGLFVIATFWSYSLDHQYFYLEDAEGTLLVFQSKKEAQDHAVKTFRGQYGLGWTIHTADRMREILNGCVAAATHKFPS